MLNKWIIVLVLCLAATPAWAKGPKGKNDHLLEQKIEKSYVLPYAIVGLGVGLGMMMVARPVTRREFDKHRDSGADDDEE